MGTDLITIVVIIIFINLIIIIKGVSLIIKSNKYDDEIKEKKEFLENRK